MFWLLTRAVIVVDDVVVAPVVVVVVVVVVVERVLLPLHRLPLFLCRVHGRSGHHDAAADRGRRAGTPRPRVEVVIRSLDGILCQILLCFLQINVSLSLK